MRTRTIVILVLVPLTALVLWLGSRDRRADPPPPSDSPAAKRTPSTVPSTVPPTSPKVAAPRPSLDTPVLEHAGDRVAAGRRVAIRPVSEVREQIRGSAAELVAKLEAIRVEVRLSDEQWEAVLQDLLEAAIERRRNKEFLTKDAMGQPMTDSDRRSASDAGVEDLRARLASYLTPKQLRAFEFRLDLRAAIGWVENTDVLQDRDQPDLRLYPNVGEAGLTDL